MNSQPTSLIDTWGTTAAERTMPFPCDHQLTQFDATYFRAITILAPAPIIFRWFCQLRVAPYSYDWLDNGGRLSPRELTPGLDQLHIGQSMCSIFQLTDFSPNHYLTLRITSPHAKKFFGETIICYLIQPQDNNRCRLIVKLLIRYPSSIIGTLMRPCLPLGDLIMMRKQLLTFKHLAEQQYKNTATNPTLSTLTTPDTTK